MRPRRVELSLVWALFAREVRVGRFWWRWIQLVVVALAWFGSKEVLGQGVVDPVVVNTVAGQELTGATTRFAFGSGIFNPGIRMKVGFASNETDGPGIFSDAFTVTLQTDDRSVTLVLVTLDPRGAVWAPSTPSTTPISEESIGRAMIAYPDLTPVLVNRQAYQMEVALPESVLGQSLTMYFDLFSNDNGIPSQGWYGELTLIPEPSVTWLVAVGLAGMWWARRRAR